MRHLCPQVLYVGGLFPQFFIDSDELDDISMQAAVQLAFDRVNNKTDGVYDTLLPNHEVRCVCLHICFDFCIFCN